MNVAIGLALGSAVGVAIGSPAAGLVAVALSLLPIYYRGYLVPGTPALTRRYLPASVRRLFGKPDGARADESDPRVGGDRFDGDLEALLESAGIVTECEDADEPCLTDDFRRSWRREMRRLGERDSNVALERLAAELDEDVDADRLSATTESDRFAVSLDGTQLLRWNSRAAFVADVAAVAELRSRCAWDALEEDVRSRILAVLRTFLSDCPLCETELTAVEDSADLCCGAVRRVSIECDGCGAVVFSSSHR